MQRRGLVAFVMLNVLISAGVVLGVLSLTSGEGGEVRERLVTFEVIVTATPDPNVTPQVIVVTATGDPNQPVLPPDLLGTTQAGVPTAIPTNLDPSLVAQSSAAGLPPNCIIHIVADGENPSIIAGIYGANLFDLLAVNGLDEETATIIQIGQELIVPLEGCSLIEAPPPTAGPEDGPEVTAENGDGTPGGTQTPGARATITLAPTAANAQVEIRTVIGAGDITTEGVVVRNLGNTINLSGWTLSDTDGNVYVIPSDRRLFSGAEVTIYTRSGQNTPVVLYWGRDTAVFGEPGDAVILADANGVVQATLRLP